MTDETDVMKERKRKLELIIQSGVNPYPYSYNQTNHSEEVKQQYHALQPGEKTEQNVNVAGRLTRISKMGKLTFADIMDGEGFIQICFSREVLGNEAYQSLKMLDIGDIVGIGGKVFKSNKGEITVNSDNYTLLCKSLTGLPEKFHGLKDPEIRYRHRSLDMISDPGVILRFKQRSKAITAMRTFLDNQGFLEVETPVLQAVYGGASARPFKTHVNALGTEYYLQISPELYLKRLMVGGLERVYTICKNFRNEGIDKTHNPEFTMMECYQAFADYNDMMKLTEQMYAFIFSQVAGKTKVNYQGTEIDFTPPWKRVRMYDLIEQVTGKSPDVMTEDQLKQMLYDKGYKETDVEGRTKGELAAEVFGKYVEETLIQPTFVIDHPIETTPLCKPHRERPDLIERFEPFVYGCEIGNAYSELNNPVLQRKFLEQQAEKGRAGDQEAHQMDEDFCHAIDVGMPPAGGLGLGIDRLVMFLTNAPSIKEVIAFPLMKRQYQTEE